MAKQQLSRLKRIVAGPKRGADEDIPFLESELTRLDHFAHFCVLIVESFVRNRCLVRAAALSFSTLLALIPMLAVAIGVTGSLLKSEGEDQIYAAINQFVATLVPPGPVTPAASAASRTQARAVTPDATTNGGSLLTSNVLALVATRVAGETNSGGVLARTNNEAPMITAQKEAARDIHDFVQNTRSGALGMLGMLLLVYVAISMLANVEATFNDIWGVTRGRNWLWRIVLYWAVLTLCPLALIGAYSVAGLHLATAREVLTQMPAVGSLFFQGLGVAVLCLVFAVVYLTVPNTKVRWNAALAGGVVAGVAWHLNNELGYLYISRVVTNSKIYGSLGLVPVLMAGLYFSWVILLFGVQVAYAFQNRLSCLQDKFAEDVNQRGREFIALRLMTALGVRYLETRPPATVSQIACELGISIRLTLQILQPLLATRLVNELAGAEATYCPARPLDAITAHHVLLAVRCPNKPVVFTNPGPVRDEIYGEFARIEEAERAAASGVSLLAMVRRAQARLAAPVPSPALPGASAESPPLF